MKWLSVRQPWAALIAAGLKDVENRSKPTAYRGPVMIHASATPEPDAGVCCLVCPRETCDGCPLRKPGEGYPARKIDSLPYGAAIAVVDIVGCKQDHPSPWAQPGMHHLVLANPRPLSWFVPCRGRLGIFNGPDIDELYRPHDGRTRRVDLRQELADLVVARPGKWGNPYKVGRGEINYRTGETRWPVKRGKGVHEYLCGYFPTKQEALAACLDFYGGHVRDSSKLMKAIKAGELHGKRLGCFCEAHEACHGDVLVKIDREVF